MTSIIYEMSYHDYNMNKNVSFILHNTSYFSAELNDLLPTLEAHTEQSLFWSQN